MQRGAVGRDQRELNVKFKVVKFLGKGSYGSVFQVQRLSDGMTYALKEMDVKSMSQAEREDAANEIRLLASVTHPNVIAYHEAFLDGNRLCIIMEYAPDGDLSKVIKKHQMLKRPMAEDLIWKYFIQITRGLSALHNMKILHRDIKPGNIMVMQNDVAKIGDLGIAKLLTSTMAAKTQIGTPHYMPPEIWRNRPYAFSSDSWAIGCLLYEMATFNVPFEARSMSELRYKVLRGTYPPVPSTYSQDLQQLVRSCLDPNPDKRPSMDQILNMHAVASRMRLLPSDMTRAGPPSTAGSVLLDTIKVPRNFQMIKGKLPPAQYASDVPNLMGFEPIPEGTESSDGTDMQRLPNIMAHRPQQQKPALPQPLRPAPGRLPPAGCNNAPGRLPAVPGAGAPSRAMYAPRARAPPPMGVAGALGGDGGADVRAQQAALLQPYLQQGAVKAKPSVQVPPPSSAYPDDSMWYPKDGRISESHAQYGAFYHNSPTAAAAAAAVAAQMRAYEDPRAPPPNAHNAYANLQQQAAAIYANAYPDKRVGGGGGYVGAGIRLPALQAQQGRAVPPNAAALLGSPSKPPPWNYGAGRASSIAPVGQPRNFNAALAAAGVAAPEGAGAGNINRYPPPQWAPKPVGRW